MVRFLNAPVAAPLSARDKAEASPARSTYSLHAEFLQGQQMKIAHTRFSKFIRELGFAGDRKPAG